MPQTDTALSGVEMRGPPAAFAGSSSLTPSQASLRHSIFSSDASSNSLHGAVSPSLDDDLDRSHFAAIALALVRQIEETRAVARGYDRRSSSPATLRLSRILRLSDPIMPDGLPA